MDADAVMPAAARGHEVRWSHAAMQALGLKVGKGMWGPSPLQGLPDPEMEMPKKLAFPEGIKHKQTQRETGRTAPAKRLQGTASAPPHSRSPQSQRRVVPTLLPGLQAQPSTQPLRKGVDGPSGSPPCRAMGSPQARRRPWGALGGCGGLSGR